MAELVEELQIRLFSSDAPFIILDGKQTDIAFKVARAVHASFYNWKQDHCALLIDSDNLKGFVADCGLETDLVDPGYNMFWSGIQRRGQHRWKRVIVGDYADWFSWYMGWQRFHAFRVLVLIEPVKYMLGHSYRGYMDGLLTRLVTKGNLHRVIVIESTEFLPLVERWLGKQSAIDPSHQQLLGEKFKEQELKQAIFALLYGTRLTRKQLFHLLRKTFWFNIYGDLHIFDEVFRHLLRWFVSRRHRWFLSLDEYGMKLVQGLWSIPDRVPLSEELPQDYEKIFSLRGKAFPVKADEKWLENLVLEIIAEDGWSTIGGLQGAVYSRVQEMIKSGGVAELENALRWEGYINDWRSLYTPHYSVVKRIMEKLVSDGLLQRETWFAEVGRPTAVYYLPGRLPFREDARCGQCAFYVATRRRCRLWWLARKMFTVNHPRWSRDGEYPLSGFEIYKMKNSSRVSPRSSACLKFVDKKNDYVRRPPEPERCDICQQDMPRPEQPSSLFICKNCGTRCVLLRRKVKVLPAYEHEFQRIYREVTDRSASEDFKHVKEAWWDTVWAVLEKQAYQARRGPLGSKLQTWTPTTLMLFPGDDVRVAGNKLIVYRGTYKKTVDLRGLTIVDYGSLNDYQIRRMEKAGVSVRRVLPYRRIPPQYFTIQPELRAAVDKAAEDTEFLRRLALAMARSAIIATERIAHIGKVDVRDLGRWQKEQMRFAERLRVAPPSSLLSYEALIMRRYWECYGRALVLAQTWLGPRKKARFVREYVANPSVRAKGYSAVDAAINYLHQRRIFKARLIGMKLGLGWRTGEGFLHRAKFRRGEIGLLLDLVDPFKFADREKVLHAFLEFKVNWRDFYIEADRVGANFYYPKPQAIEVLEQVGSEADQMLVQYDGKTMNLQEALRLSTFKLVDALYKDTLQTYTPFVYKTEEDNLKMPLI